VKKDDFIKVRQGGKNYSGPFFSILVLAREQSLPSRFGVIVSTKLSKRATKRNRAKRILREATRSFLPQVKAGFDIVFLGRRGLMEEKNFLIKEEVERIFKQANLFCRAVRPENKLARKDTLGFNPK
jgi:ribonuclease P protein component